MTYCITKESLNLAYAATLTLFVFFVSLATNNINGSGDEFSEVLAT